MQITYEAQKSAAYLPIILNPLLRGNNYVQFCNAFGVCEQKVRALEEEEEFPISLMVCFCFSCVYANAFIQPHNSPLRKKISVCGIENSAYRIKNIISFIHTR